MKLSIQGVKVAFAEILRVERKQKACIALTLVNGNVMNIPFTNENKDKAIKECTQACKTLVDIYKSSPEVTFDLSV